LLYFNSSSNTEYYLATIVLIAGLFLLYSTPSLSQNSSFGIKTTEIGLGLSPLGLSNENDLDSFIEYGGFITIVTRNPDDFMLSFAASNGFSKVNPPVEDLSAGPFSLTRLEVFLLYGRYVYGGLGVGYFMFDHSINDDAQQWFTDKGLSGEESVASSMAYSLKVGVKSSADFGYFVEATVSLTSTEVESTVVDLYTNNTATTTAPFDLRLIQFFKLGVFYRF